MIVDISISVVSNCSMVVEMDVFVIVGIIGCGC